MIAATEKNIKTLWGSGWDTMMISTATGQKESTIYNTLHKIREAEKMPKVISEWDQKAIEAVRAKGFRGMGEGAIINLISASEIKFQNLRLTPFEIAEAAGWRKPANVSVTLWGAKYAMDKKTAELRKSLEGKRI